MPSKRPSRGHRRDVSPKREKSADPYAQSSRPSTSTSFRTVCPSSAPGSGALGPKSTLFVGASGFASPALRSFAQMRLDAAEGSSPLRLELDRADLRKELSERPPCPGAVDREPRPAQRPDAAEHEPTGAVEAPAESPRARCGGGPISGHSRARPAPALTRRRRLRGRRCPAQSAEAGWRARHGQRDDHRRPGASWRQAFGAGRRRRSRGRQTSCAPRTVLRPSRPIRPVYFDVAGEHPAVDIRSGCRLSRGIGNEAQIRQCCRRTGFCRRSDAPGSAGLGDDHHLRRELDLRSQRDARVEVSAQPGREPSRAR